MNGEAADEVVRMVLNGSEVAIRLTGSAAKNLAAILVAWSKNHKKVYGKTSMMKLLRSGEELQVLSLTKEQYQDFKASARKQVLFAPFVDTKSEDEKVDVVIEAKSIPLVNHILDRIGYTQIEPEKEKGCSPVALQRYLIDHPEIKFVNLGLDNDQQGRNAAENIKEMLGDAYKVYDHTPDFGKDYNEDLMYRQEQYRESKKEKEDPEPER